MSSTLKVNEKYSRHWPAIAVLSAILSVIFYITYQLSADVLLEGYLRLTAFGFFALAVLSLFKVKDGRMEITFNQKPDLLEVVYRVRNRIVHEEEIRLIDVESVKVDIMPNKSLYNDFMKSDRCVRFKRKDSEGWIYLNEINGRVIPLNADNANAISEFVTNRKG